MKRPAPASILTALVWLALAAAVVFVIVIQQDRINRGNERYDSLFGAYQELTRDCDQANDCYTDAPTPAEVVKAQPGDPGSPGADGANGSPGRDGVDGEDGINGVDGTAGTQGPPGAAGTNGADGSPGAPGAAGSDGQPPTSWTFEIGGITYTCARTDPFDATAPTYTCNQETP